MTTTVLSAQNLSVSRGGSSVLKDLNFHVASGEVYALLGGNGAGKSTTLLTFMGFLAPTDGKASVLGMSADENCAAVRKSIAYLPENASLYGHLTAMENIRYFLSLANTSPRDDSIHNALDSVNLNQAARHRHLSTYSKGMRQKVAVALAILRETPVVFLDEPTSGLDPAAVEDFHTVVDQLSSKGVSILMVTHDLFGACQVATSIGLLRDGQLVGSFAREAGKAIDVDAVREMFIRRDAA
ncbi:MAG: ABC transporter ATP-binding protein [Pseudohongiellaceae bacterium]